MLEAIQVAIKQVKKANTSDYYTYGEVPDSINLQVEAEIKNYIEVAKEGIKKLEYGGVKFEGKELQNYNNAFINLLKFNKLDSFLPELEVKENTGNVRGFTLKIKALAVRRDAYPILWSFIKILQSKNEIAKDASAEINFLYEIEAKQLDIIDTTDKSFCNDIGDHAEQALVFELSALLLDVISGNFYKNVTADYLKVIIRSYDDLNNLFNKLPQGSAQLEILTSLGAQYLKNIVLNALQLGWLLNQILVLDVPVSIRESLCQNAYLKTKINNEFDLVDVLGELSDQGCLEILDQLIQDEDFKEIINSIAVSDKWNKWNNKLSAVNFRSIVNMLDVDYLLTKIDNNYALNQLFRQLPELKQVELLNKAVNIEHIKTIINNSMAHLGSLLEALSQPSRFKILEMLGVDYLVKMIKRPEDLKCLPGEIRLIIIPQLSADKFKAVINGNIKTLCDLFYLVLEQEQLQQELLERLGGVEYIITIINNSNYFQKSYYLQLLFGAQGIPSSIKLEIIRHLAGTDCLTKVIGEIGNSMKLLVDLIIMLEDSAQLEMIKQFGVACLKKTINNKEANLIMLFRWLSMKNQFEILKQLNQGNYLGTIIKDGAALASLIKPLATPDQVEFLTNSIANGWLREIFKATPELTEWLTANKFAISDQEQQAIIAKFSDSMSDAKVTSNYNGK